MMHDNIYYYDGFQAYKCINKYKYDRQVARLLNIDDRGVLLEATDTMFVIKIWFNLTIIYLVLQMD